MIVQENENLHSEQNDKPKSKIQLMTSALDLNPEQAKKVEKIFAKTYNKVKPLIQEKLDHYKNAKDEIGSLLNEQQRRKWEARNAAVANKSERVSS